MSATDSDPDSGLTPSDSGPAAASSEALDSPITFRYELTADDLAAFYTDAETVDPYGRRAWGRIRRHSEATLYVALLLTALLVIGVAFDVFGMATLEQGFIITVGLAAAVVGAWWTFAQYRMSLAPVTRLAHASAYVHTEEAQYHLGPQVLTVGPSGLVLLVTHHDLTQRWSGIATISETSSAVCLLRRDRVCFVVPKRIFPSPDAAADFARRAQRWLSQSGHGDPRQIVEFLRTHDAACPDCGYNLRGITFARCPECGHDVDPSIITRPPSP